ncbi:MAG: hypothetical protein KGZ25_13455, partial [Planctomycetes bacterium]|nr:hypothetical protein [Planctomycetota bacterium]
IDELRVSDRARKYYPYDLAKTRLTAGPDFPLGQPYLRDPKEQIVHLSFKEGLLPAEMREKADDQSYPEKADAAFVPGVHDRAAKTGPKTRTPAYGFPKKFSARSATLEFWFSPYDWDNGLARPKPEGNAEQRVVKYRPLRAPYQVVPLVGISSRGISRSDKERWLVRISAHQMWTPLRHHTPSVPPEIVFRPGTWYHLTITIDHGRVGVYVNGEPIDGYLLDIQTAAAPSDHALRRVVFGRAFPWKRRRAFARGKHSLIDEVRLYSRPLTPPEIKNLYARYLPEVKEEPLPFAHSVLKLQPVRRRAVSDVTLLGPERDRVNTIQLNVTDANGQSQLERSLPPLKDGRTWTVSDGVFVPTETFNTTWVFSDKDGGKLHRQQEELERPEFDPYRTAEQPPFNLAYYPSMKSARIQFNPVWEMGTIRSDFLTSEDGRLGLDAHYYADPACEGDPVTRQVDPEVGFKWENTPAHNISPDYFGVIWTGTLGPILYEGEYLIRTVADSGTRLWIDGKKVIDCWPDAPKSPKVAEIVFEKDSRHELKVQYGARGGESKCYLQWRLKTRPPASNQDPASMHVLNADGKTLIDRSIPIGKWCEQLVEIGPVPDGVYRCEIKMPGGRKYYPRWFERRHFVWEENQLGITKNVYPPFEPIKVNEDELGVVMRRYKVDGLGFWKSVRAKGNETPFREILAAPIALEINDGKVFEGNGKFTKTAAHEVVYEGTAQHPAVSINSRCITEYDGCMRVELTLEPAQEGQELENLSLRIPIKNEMAPLWHTVKTRIRGNPAGRAPRGTGKVWDSRRFRAGAMPGNFLPYIWLGAEERGICWFADNERGWVLDRENKDPCLTLEQKNGVLSLRVHLVQKPVVLKDKRRIVFGIMASPGKPMPENWRKVLFSGRRRGFKSIGWSGSTYWGCAETMHETYPLGRDFDVLNKFQEVRLTGKKAGVNEFKKAWERRHLSDYEPKGRKQPEQIMGLVDHMINFSWRGQPDYRNVYWEEFFSVSWHHPETQMFLDEWYGDSRFGFRPSKSYLDFQCWYGAEFIRRGIGLYFDNTFPKGASN